MAGEGDAKDFRAHENTYAFFSGLMKWGAILSFIVAFLVIWIIHA